MRERKISRKFGCIDMKKKANRKLTLKMPRDIVMRALIAHDLMAEVIELDEEKQEWLDEFFTYLKGEVDEGKRK